MVAVKPQENIYNYSYSLFFFLFSLESFMSGHFTHQQIQSVYIELQEEVLKVTKVDM